MSSDYKYIAIDLKSFYASVECVDRGLDPLTTHLVVADPSRTEKTICLAVTPCLKAEGVSGRARLFEVVSRVREINAERLGNLRKLTNNFSTTSAKSYSTNVIPRNKSLKQTDIIREGDCTGRDLETYSAFKGNIFSGASVYPENLENNSSLELDYIIAKPRMAKYIEVSTEIYKVYLKYFSPADIHVYSIDEVFIDISKYTAMYHSDAQTLATKVVSDVFNTTGITATAGIGTNLYLAKIAMDILAKHEEADEYGMRMAALNEDLYKRFLWDHTPITDFWRIGRGIAKRLATCGMYTMGDVARCSLGTLGQKMSEDVLYNMLGKNAELLIDHAWGVEPLRMEDIKNYRPSANSKTTGQVLTRPYTTEECRTIVWEMADELALDLMKSALVTKKITVTIGYDTKSLEDPRVLEDYIDHIHIDHNGKPIPNHAHGTFNLIEQTSLSHDLTTAALKLYDRIIDERLFVRRVNITACDVVSESSAKRAKSHGQLALFDIASIDEPDHDNRVKHEKDLQNALLHVRAKFGKNAVFRAASLKDEGMQIERNSQIGGHKA